MTKEWYMEDSKTLGYIEGVDSGNTFRAEFAKLEAAGHDADYCAACAYRAVTKQISRLVPSLNNTDIPHGWAWTSPQAYRQRGGDWEIATRLDAHLPNPFIPEVYDSVTAKRFRSAALDIHEAI